jgi:DNA-binding transcriptional ArsR family regulator
MLSVSQQQTLEAFMKRDMSIIRRILIELESGPKYTAISEIISRLDGIDQVTATYHLEIADELKLISCTIEFCDHDPEAIIILAKLTNNGHAMLEVMRDETIWNRFLKGLKDRGIQITIEAVIAAGLAGFR